MALTNTASAGGAQVAVTSVSVSGGLILDYFFNAVNGQDTYTGAALAPGKGSNRAGTIQFTDNASASPQSGSLMGQAN